MSVARHENPEVIALMEAAPGLQRATLRSWGLPDVGLLILMSACDGRCFFCAQAVVTDPPPEMITPWARTRGWLESARGDAAATLCLGGTEPTSHPDFHRTLALAREVGFGGVQLMTSGLRLATPGVAGAWREAGVRSVCCPVYSAEADAHDGVVRVPGHHARLLVGLDAARAAGLEVFVHSLALRRTLGGLGDLAELTRDRWGATLAVAPLRAKEGLFDYAAEAPSLREVDRALTGAPLSLVGFPACVAPDLPRGAPPLITLYFLSQARGFAAECSGCSARAACPGVVAAALGHVEPGELRPR